MAAESLTLLVFPHVPVISDALGQHPLDAAAWLPVLVTPWLFLSAEEARTAIVRRRRHLPRP